ncbi:MAG: SDR family oxidoreductase [Kiritimatiellae bacterium]|nr:SDR family oxidoreductase [Kiritimatiellia bacterium]
MELSLPRKALVTGAAGFLGSHLCRRLLEDGYEVTALDNLFTGTKRNIEGFLANPRFSFVLHDVTQPYWGQFDEIYNLACPASPVHYQHNPVETTKSSVLGIMNMLDLALKTKARLLHTSTSEIYGDPLVHPQVESYWGNVNTIGVRSCYDEGKRCAETLAADYRREYGVDVRMVRIFNTYGPNMHPKDGRVISNFIMQALRDEDITIFGDGSQTRSFQYCDDLVEAMRRYMELPRAEVDAFCARHALGAPVVNTGNPGEYTIRQLAEETLRLIPESKSKIVSRPIPADDPKRRKPDISLAKELLGWEPVIPLREGLAKTIGYFRAFVSERGSK